MYADIFITAVVTGSLGQNGMSVLLVHKDSPGFTVRKVNIRGADLSGTAALCRQCEFVNVKLGLIASLRCSNCRHGVFGFSKRSRATGSSDWFGKRRV
jgi:hypothetical protein